MPRCSRRIALAEAQNWRCAYCGVMMTSAGGGPRLATVDHLRPRARGGGGALSNLISACFACNSSRGHITNPDEFHRLRRKLRSRRLWRAGEFPPRSVARVLLEHARRDAVRCERFSVSEIRTHLAVHLPSCPWPVRLQIVKAVRRRRWSQASLGKAVGIVATDLARRRFTDFERLKAGCGLTDFEARLAVRLEVRDILDAWAGSRPR